MRKTMLLAACCLAVAPAALALPANEVTTEFYSDASRSKLVGESILTCGGGRVMWGHRTGFSDRSSDPCRGKRLVPVPASIADVAMLHQSPLASCTLQCTKGHHLVPVCPQGSCDPGVDACVQACHDAFDPIPDAQ